MQSAETMSRGSVLVLLQFDVCEAIHAQTKEALAALGRHLSGITSKRQIL
jgi:hypothetical protein